MLNEDGPESWSALCPCCHEVVAAGVKTEEKARGIAHEHILDIHHPDRREGWIL